MKSLILRAVQQENNRHFELYAGTGEERVAVIDYVKPATSEASFLVEKERAEFMVKACNAHKELLEACKSVVREKELHGSCVDSSMECRRIIAKIEGE